MRAKLSLFVSVSLSLFLMSVAGRADFKYTQTSQITGGAMAGMVKAMGVFNKKLREPAETTTYVKSAYLRSDHSDGSYQLIDLNGQRIIEVNPSQNSYSVATFEQMREALAKMQQRMKEEMNQQAREKNTNVTMTPKIDIKSSGRSQNLLGQNTQEVNIRVAMEMQATGANQPPQAGSFGMTIDSWIAPSITGYNEVTEFYKKMAVEIGWSPNTTFPGDPRMGQAMIALYKEGKIPTGLPLLQTVNLNVAGSGPSNPQQPPAESQESSQESATPGEAAAKALGGMFGGFGHKRKNQEQSSAQPAAQPDNSSASGSMMEITMRVTSFSTDSLDSSLFVVPAGYKQVESDMQRLLTAGH